jgi:polyphosphate kinase 2 (PPK2 family)
MAAYAEALATCSTAVAPWHVVPADRKWYRDLAVARIVAAAARRMNPSFPEPEEDLSGVVIPD